MHLLALLLTLWASLSPEMQRVADHISENSLREHLSYIASDELEGRATPSRGLDLAAEYIAAQYKAAGLEPAGDDGYFQTATLSVREPNWVGFRMTLSSSSKTVQIDKSGIYLLPDAELNLDSVNVVSIDARTQVTAELVDGKVVFIADPRAQRSLQGFKPLLVLAEARQLPAGAQVRDPEVAPRGLTTSLIAKGDATELLKGNEPVRVTLHAAAARDRQVKARNVAGLLRGSDPVLSDTYVLLTAHYDHIGVGGTGPDRIYNGANDDGSGTVSVVEIASALAALDIKPKRSILFVTFFGEERGLLGSRYYVRHPTRPLEKTIAQLNLEQIGRTDATNGPQIATASLTGFDFSDIPKIVAEAGEQVGVKVYKDAQASDAFFSRSDNQALADAGVPAHTLCVAFNYPDYHRVGDESSKIDYANMAKVDRAIALALMRIASEEPAPKWNESYAPARRYVEAGKKLHN